MDVNMVSYIKEHTWIVGSREQCWQKSMDLSRRQ
jgi:hypothetical protein